MIKNVCFVFLLLAKISLSQTNENKIIELNDFYDTKGIIFLHNDTILKKINAVSGFEPTVKDVKNGEKIILDLVQEIVGNVQYDNEIIGGNLRTYYRQYLGIINTSHEKLLFINLLDFSGIGYIYFHDYPVSIITKKGNISKYYRTFIVNLSKKELDETSPDGLDDLEWFLKNELQFYYEEGVIGGEKVKSLLKIK